MAQIRVPTLKELKDRKANLEKHVEEKLEIIKEPADQIASYATVASAPQINKKFVIPENYTLPSLDISILSEKLFGFQSPTIDEVRMNDVMETQLTAEENFVIRTRCAGVSLQELSDITGVSRARIRVVEDNSLRKLARNSAAFVTF